MTEAEMLTIISELNAIEVRGEENLDRLLGVIKFINFKRQDMMQARLAAAAAHPKEETGDG